MADALSLRCVCVRLASSIVLMVYFSSQSLEKQKRSEGRELAHHTYPGRYSPKMEFKNIFGTGREKLDICRSLAENKMLLSSLKQTQQDACRLPSQGCNPELLAEHTHPKMSLNQSNNNNKACQVQCQGRLLSFHCTG